MDACVTIELSQEVKDSLDNTSQELKKFLSGGFIEKDNHRIILKYIKNVNKRSMNSIESALEEVCRKSVPFTVVCNDLEYLDPRNKSQLVYTLRGNASKLESLQQYIENIMFKRGINRSDHIDFPYIAMSYVMPIRPIPTVSVPMAMIRIGQVHLLQVHNAFGKRTTKEIATYTLTGGHLLVKELHSNYAVCQNEYDLNTKIKIELLPNHVSEGDVVKMVGSIYVQDLDKTRVYKAHQAVIKNDF